MEKKEEFERKNKHKPEKPRPTPPDNEVSILFFRIEREFWKLILNTKQIFHICWTIDGQFEAHLVNKSFICVDCGTNVPNEVINKLREFKWKT